MFCCPCCGKATLTNPTNDELCSKCGWIDDGIVILTVHSQKNDASIISYRKKIN